VVRIGGEGVKSQKLGDRLSAGRFPSDCAVYELHRADAGEFTQQAEVAAPFLLGGAFPEPGAKLFNPDIAGTLQAICGC
jgi:hypothetical protein